MHLKVKFKLQMLIFNLFRSRQPVSLNEWHVVRISRTGRDGYLQLDNQAAVEGMSKGAYTQLTLTLDLFVGGHRNFDEVAKNANIRKAFKGCIQKVSLLCFLLIHNIEKVHLDDLDLYVVTSAVVATSVFL